MKIELKNVKHAKFLSQETEAFTADIWVDGKKAGYAENDGHGGCTNIQPHTVWEKLEKYAQSLPPVVTDMEDPHDKSKPFTYQQGADSLVDDLLQEHLITKELTRKMKNKVLTTKDGKFYTISGVVSSERVEREKAKGFTILNELPFDEALALWRKSAA